MEYIERAQFPDNLIPPLRVASDRVSQRLDFYVDYFLSGSKIERSHIVGEGIIRPRYDPDGIDLCGIIITPRFYDLVPTLTGKKRIILFDIFIPKGIWEPEPTSACMSNHPYKTYYSGLTEYAVPQKAMLALVELSMSKLEAWKDHVSK